MLKLALIGKNIGHSRSQEMYEKITGQEVDYSLLDYSDTSEIPPLKDFFSKGYQGLSVTFPYKKAFASQIDVNEGLSHGIEAINCMKMVGGKVYATNTDFLAAKFLLEELANEDLSFVVLGSGNMAKVFEVAFNILKKEVTFLSRATNGDLNQIPYESFEKKGSRLFVINCCSRDFVFRSSLPVDSVFWDMNYSFKEHEYMKKAPFTYREGSDLLLHQAKFALRFWNL